MGTVWEFAPVAINVRAQVGPRLCEHFHDRYKSPIDWGGGHVMVHLSITKLRNSSGAFSVFCVYIKRLMVELFFSVIEPDGMCFYLV